MALRGFARPLVAGRQPGRPGVVLIFAAGILTILAALGMAFFATTHSSMQSSVRYSDMVRAELLTQAGIQEAVARLRVSAFIKTEDPTDNWYTTDWFANGQRRPSFRMGDGKDTDGDGIVDNESGKTYKPYTRVMGSSVGEQSDRFTLDVEDAGGKINLNACDNLAVVLDNLCRLIGPPLVAADPDLLQPQRWNDVSGGTLTAYAANTQDTKENRDLYYAIDAQGRPVQGNQAPYAAILASLGKSADGSAVYGDGYAIAGYRGRNGPFGSAEELKNALPFVDRNGNGIADDPLELMEIEAKYAALKPYITLASWVDTNTVCVGKFEWVRNDVSLDVAVPQNGSPIYPNASVAKTNCQVLIDRDKSWVADDPASDPLNQRGSLRGSYVSIMNGHGAGQLRRIATNGTDWIAINATYGADERMTVEPGPISSYMIIAAEDALLDLVPNTSPPVYVPRMNADGTLVDHPYIDYVNRPLCIHRSPVNLNTASDKVLAALLMGLDVQHGHYLSIGTDADFQNYEDRTKATAWYKDDPNSIEPYLLTINGLKRMPADSGKLVFTRPAPAAPTGSTYTMDYLNCYGTANGSGLVNEAVELAQRIMVARAKDPAFNYYDAAAHAVSGTATATSYQRKPFTSWDDLYFRVIKPWDDQRRVNSAYTLKVYGVSETHYHKPLVAKMLMANSNPNTDILKFNPNIEWIDRWGRNFVDMEPVMLYTNQPLPHNNNPAVADPITASSIPIYSTSDPLLKSSQRDAAGNFIQGAYLARSYRYRSDDLIDKTDLNRSTTEFAFNSNGIFEITSTGQVVSTLTGQLLAERKTEAALKVYDVWTESTQRQFVNGKISKATGARGTAYSGQVSRDAYNQTDRLALNTLPEPLVPLTYRIQDSAGNNNNLEVVSPSGAFLDAYGNVRTNPVTSETGKRVPDVIANRILPAQWDGQVVLATNTSAFDPNNDKDTFLATFDGDQDTADCLGNGREQAKVPHRADGQGNTVRVVHSIGLLGLLNDTMQVRDPGLPMLDPADPVNGYRWVYRFSGMNAIFQPLNSAYYWNNVTMRMGDLRSDGVYLSSPGVSGNAATLKYLFSSGDGKNDDKANFNSGSLEGNDITLWFKSTWHQDDFRTHEFFNASNPGQFTNMARGCYLMKYGQYIYAFQDWNPGIGHSGNRTKTNTLSAFWEVESSKPGAPYSGMDWDVGGFLHGGYDCVPRNLPHRESTSFHIQPFRWQFTGMRRNALSQWVLPATEGPGQRGHWMDSKDYANPKSVDTLTHHIRPFIDSQLYPEGETTWNYKQFFCFRSVDTWAPTRCDVGNYAGGADLDPNGARGQDVSWQWADGGRKSAKAFSINNLNFGNMNKVTNGTQVFTHYRFMPEDGTYAVIDELKISSRDRILQDDAKNIDWTNDRVVREQSLSRYYLPPKAADLAALPTAGGPPTFTSQTLMQSRRGFDKTLTSDRVSLVRATWTVFTPRFMHEYKVVSDARYKRTEYVTYGGPFATNQNPATITFRGPFDYLAYNDNSYVGNMGGDGNGRVSSYISVARPTPAQYGGQAQATKGVRVQLLCDPDGVVDSGDETAIASFTDPDAYNCLGTVTAPTLVAPTQLRYRIQFLYPVDALVDPFAGGTQVDPNNHLLLDTPVFDDISITYYTKTRIMAYRPIWE